MKPLSIHALGMLLTLVLSQPVDAIEKWGYINKTGEFVIKPQFAKAEPFSKGTALVTPFKPGKCPVDGLNFVIDTVSIDLEGHRLPTKVENNWQVTYYSQPLDYALPILKHGPLDKKEAHGLIRRINGWCYVDTSERVVFEPPTSAIAMTEFSEGLAAIAINSTLDNQCLWGFIDSSGNWVIKPQFTNDRPDRGERSFSPRFMGGLAAVAIRGPGLRRFGYIDKTGKFMIQPNFIDATDFVDGLAAVSYETGLTAEELADLKKCPRRFSKEKWQFDIAKDPRIPTCDKCGSKVSKTSWVAMGHLRKRVLKCSCGKTVIDWLLSRISKEQLWEHFVVEYPITGMGRSQLIDFLGIPSAGNNSYDLGWTRVVLQFEGDRVSGWHYAWRPL